MSDGIIQKVFTKYSSMYSDYHPVIRGQKLLLKRVEQELIAEIKQEFKKYALHDSYTILPIVRDELIGDTQE